jgi:endonuclease YncB( thermonuclease family)
VTDGDTIKLDGVTYRLWGIDAPESKQLCADGWPAGRAATTYMRDLLHGHAVECEARGTDRYGRTIGLCKADGVDIQAEMVKAGMAWAFVRYSRDYIGREGEAKAADLGLHAHDCQPAWEWLAQQKN